MDNDPDSHKTLGTVNCPVCTDFIILGTPIRNTRTLDPVFLTGEARYPEIRQEVGQFAVVQCPGLKRGSNRASQRALWQNLVVKIPKIIEDRERLFELAPVASADITHHVFVCCGKSCSKVGADDVFSAFVAQLESRNLRYGKETKGRNPEGPVLLTECGSIGFCSIGTAVLVYPEGVWYAQVRESDVEEIIEKHLIGGEVITRLELKTMRPD